MFAACLGKVPPRIDERECVTNVFLILIYIDQHLTSEHWHNNNNDNNINNNNIILLLIIFCRMVCGDYFHFLQKNPINRTTTKI